MKNIHLIPTEKPSSLYYKGDNYKLANSTMAIDWYISSAGYEPTNIYISSDLEIKEGDWCLCSEELVHKVVEIKSNIGIIRFQDGVTEVLNSCEKIILTTDQDLIADGVQAIDDEFLEWFVKNPTCEYVEVKHFGTCCGNQSITQCINCEKYNPIYKITIPKEEPKQDSTLENAKLALREHILANKEKVAEDLQEMREKSGTGRDETLEEAAEKYSELQAGTFTPPHKTTYKHGFEDGAKWMQEQMEKLKDFDTWKEWKNK
jgi:hypothetical protein